MCCDSQLWKGWSSPLRSSGFCFTFHRQSFLNFQHTTSFVYQTNHSIPRKSSTSATVDCKQGDILLSYLDAWAPGWLGFNLIEEGRKKIPLKFDGLQSLCKLVGSRDFVYQFHWSDRAHKLSLFVTICTRQGLSGWQTQMFRWLQDGDVHKQPAQRFTRPHADGWSDGAWRTEKLMTSRQG